MVGTITRGVQTVNSKFLKAVLGKGNCPQNSPSELPKLVVRADGREELKLVMLAPCGFHTREQEFTILWVRKK
ncbi:hypothetical protein FRX31_009816 [Thalictrum thalictroides]|uniref:Uncharacterized protein n=1 Tax=Thalictrum thalictroides TaxID=46969 RepID=A0A7J6WVG3_THATH|nr:hypothetical protein FRX31_009816 [Thalictrum thalictroides]